MRRLAVLLILVALYVSGCGYDPPGTRAWVGIPLGETPAENLLDPEQFE